jgi:N-acetylmuramoyl-L-alanine amidase
MALADQIHRANAKMGALVLELPLSATPSSFFFRFVSATLAAGVVWSLAATTIGQGTALTVLSREGRRSIPLTVVGDQEFVALDDLATSFQVTVREESGALTVTYQGRTIVLTPEQPLASIAGRLITLPARPMRAGTRWLVPVEFISRALASVYGTRLDLRRPSRLLIVGDLRVPRVTIRHEPLGNAARLTIDATPLAASVVSQEGNRLTIKFDADTLDVAPPTIQSQGIVQGVRIVDAVTLAVDLGPRFASFRASSEAIETTTRLVIDFMATSSDTTTTAPGLPPELPDLRQPATPIKTIVLDPGHGGEEGGTRGAGGTVEKDLTLTVARRLKAAIEGALGIRVILTRDDDRYMSVDDRAAVANNNKADLFVSLHANASLRPAVSGASIYVAGFSEADQARVALVPERVPVFGGGSRDIELVPWNFAQMRFVSQSIEVARLLEAQLLGRVPLTTPAISEAPFRVLESTNMPALLIEMGFLSHPDQEKQMTGNDFQNAFTQAIVETVTRLREHLTRGAGAEQ